MGTLILNVALLGDSREAYRGYISRTTTHITHPIPSVYVCNVNRRVFHNAKSVGIYHYKSQQHTIQSKKMKSLRITRLVNVEFQHIHGPTKVLTYKLQSLLIQLSRTNNLVRPKFQKNHNFKVFFLWVQYYVLGQFSFKHARAQSKTSESHTIQPRVVFVRQTNIA